MTVSNVMREEKYFTEFNMLPQNAEVPSAAHWGLMRGVVRDGVLIGVLPSEEDAAPSPKLAAAAKLPYSKARILRPMVREGYLKNGPASRNRRGDEPFVPVSWEQALELASEEIRRVYDAYGPSAVFGCSYGWKSTGKIHSAHTLQQRLLNLMGGFIRCENSYSTAAVAKILPYVVGEADPKSTSWEVVLESSETVVFWGCDPFVTNDVDWQTTLHPAYRYMLELKRRPIRKIFINPVCPETAPAFGMEDADWFAPRPGTDCAMMLGMIYELVATGEADRGFLATHVSGWEIFLDYVTGRTDGVPKTPAWAAEACGIEAGRIAALAHDLKRTRTMLMVGWGMQRQQFGEQPHWMAWALAAVLGQIGLAGGGIGTNYHYSSGGVPEGWGPAVGGIPSNVEPIRPVEKPWIGSRVIPVARFAECFLHPGHTIDFNGRKVTYPDVKLVMWAGGNPFAHQPDANKLRTAWKKPETVIVTDSVWTATARHADIVLPASTTWERNDITGIGSLANEGIAAMRQAIAPQGESRSDYWIFSALAKRLGVGDAFTQGRSDMDWIRLCYDEARKAGDGMSVKLPAFEAFWEKGVERYAVAPQARRYVAFEAFRADPQAHPLATESGKIMLFSPRIAGYGYEDCWGHPAFFPPTEQPACSDAGESVPDLALVSSKSSLRLHSQLDGLSEDPADAGREPLWIHPKDAEIRGIVTGDIVLVRNRRGRVLAAARVTPRVRQGVVVLQHGAWYDPIETKEGFLDLRGNANTLTMDVPTSKLACGNIASSGFVVVEKWNAGEGGTPAPRIFGAPEIRENA